MSKTRDDYIREWQQAATVAKQWADYERKLRDFIVSNAFPGKEIGTHRVDLGGGFNLKVALGYNYTVDHNMIDACLDMVRREPDGLIAADAIIKWNPSLVLAEYAAATPGVRNALAPAITQKPKAPVLEVEPPKA